MYSLLLVLLVAGWETQSSGVSATLYDADCISATEAWIVGASGTILHTADAGTTWTEQTSGTSADLFGVDFVDSLNGWIAGAGPIVLHSDDGGNSWGEQTSGAATDLFDIAFADQERGWAVGPSGTIIGTANGGTSWSSEISGEWTWFNALDAASPTDAWTVGSNWYTQTAPIFYGNGSSWGNQYEITQTQDGKGISFVDTLTGWAVGGNGAISSTSNGGANWNPQTSGSSEMLTAASAVSTEYCWIAGSNGTLLCTNDGGSSWSTEQSGTTDTLFGLAMWDELNGWAVGENGLILYRQAGTQVEEPQRGEQSYSITVFPNPVLHDLHLHLHGTLNEPIAIDLHDVTGRVVGNLYYGPVRSELRFSVQNLPGGVYFLQIKTRNSITKQRILKT